MKGITVEKLNRKEQEKEARKKDILEVAAKLFSQKDFHEVTVDEIAERVGLSKGTIYLYFENKENLFFSIIQEKTEVLFSRLQTAIQSDASYLERLEGLVQAYLSFFEEHKSYFKIIHSEKSRMDDKDRYRFKEHMVKSFYNYEDLLRQFIIEGQEQKVFRKIAPELITKALRGLLNSFTFQCIFTETECSLVEETPHVLDIFLNGVKVHKI